MVSKNTQPVRPKSGQESPWNHDWCCLLLAFSSWTPCGHVYRQEWEEDCLFDQQLLLLLLLPWWVNHANSLSSLRRANRMDDHHLLAPQQYNRVVKRVYPLHVSCQITFHLWENGVTQQSMKLMVKSSDCSDTMRIKGDQNNHLNGNGLLLGAPHCRTKEMSARLCLLVIRKKKKNIIPRVLTYFFWKPPAWKIQICSGKWIKSVSC